jgi:hypothetical protein
MAVSTQTAQFWEVPTGNRNPFKVTSIAVAGMLAAGVSKGQPANAGLYTETFTTGHQHTAQLLAEISALKARVAKLEAAFEIVEELDWDDALLRARAYFDARPGQSVFPDELASFLKTSISQAIELCEALEREGAIV